MYIYPLPLLEDTGFLGFSTLASVQSLTAHSAYTCHIMKGTAVVSLALCVSALMLQYLAEASAVLGSSVTESPVTPRSSISSEAATKPVSAKQKTINATLGYLAAKIAEKHRSTISTTENHEVTLASSSSMDLVSTTRDKETTVTNSSTMGPVTTANTNNITVTNSSTMGPVTTANANNITVNSDGTMGPVNTAKAKDITVTSDSTRGPVSTTKNMGSPTAAPVVGPPIPVNGVKDRSAEPTFNVNGRKVTIPMANILRKVGRPFASVSTDNATIQNEIVDLHNTFRRAVDPPASNMLKMKWNTEAAATAANWAKGCNQNRHSFTSERTITDFTCGENLFMSTFLADWSDVIASFDSEKEDFQYGSENGSKNGNVIGHYTQVVWYRSQHVGCAASLCPNSVFQYFYVCHYCPAGNTQNMIGTPYKKGAPCGDCPNSCDDKLCTNACRYQNGYSNCDDFLNKDGSCTGDDLIRDCPASCKCQATDIK